MRSKFWLNLADAITQYYRITLPFTFLPGNAKEVPRDFDRMPFRDFI